MSVSVSSFYPTTENSVVLLEKSLCTLNHHRPSVDGTGNLQFLEPPGVSVILKSADLAVANCSAVAGNTLNVKLNVWRNAIAPSNGVVR